MTETDDAAEPGRRERKRTQTLDHLAAVAFALFEEHGYDAVTMEQIAVASDVAKGTLYNHFPVKEALLAHRFHGELAGDADALRATLASRRGFAAKLSGFLAASARWCESRRAYLPHYVRWRLANFGTGARSGIDRWFEGLVAAGQKSQELRDDLQTAQIAALLQHGYLCALLRWLGDDEIALEDEFDVLVDLFVNGAVWPAKKARR